MGVIKKFSRREETQNLGTLYGEGGEAQWGETTNVSHQNILQKFSEIQLDQVIAWTAEEHKTLHLRLLTFLYA